MEYRKLKDQDQDESSAPGDLESLRGKPIPAVSPVELSKWKLKSAVTIALTVLTSSQAILIVWSKRAGKYEYSVTLANFSYYIFAYVDAPGYQILKNFNIISTGILYRIILKRKLSEIQWAAFIILSAGCTTAQLNPNTSKAIKTRRCGYTFCCRKSSL